MIVLIVVKKNSSAPPETVSLRKRAKGLNIALISVTVFGSFILYFNLIGLAMIVLSVLCLIDMDLFSSAVDAVKEGDIQTL